MADRLAALHWRIDGEATVDAVLGDGPFTQVSVLFLRVSEGSELIIILAPPTFPSSPYQALYRFSSKKKPFPGRKALPGERM